MFIKFYHSLFFSVCVLVFSGASFSAFAQDGDVERIHIYGLLFLTVIFIIGFCTLALLIVNGFHRVLDAHNKSLNLADKERILRDKEKSITASMIYAEVIDNKEKIQAYLTIHEDMLLNLKAESKQKMGDIIQKQPVLGRSVFDGNTGKLELFGEHLASEIIHYYARIKTHPDYVEVSVGSPVEDVCSMIEGAVENAVKLDHLSDVLLDSFARYALVKGMH